MRVAIVWGDHCHSLLCQSSVYEVRPRPPCFLVPLSLLAAPSPKVLDIGRAFSEASPQSRRALAQAGGAGWYVP